MVEKIVLTPLGVRGLGNIVDGKDVTDYESYLSLVTSGEDTINGELFRVNGLEYSAFNVGLHFNAATKVLYVEDDSDLVDSFTFTNKCLVLESDNVEFGFEDDALYLDSEITPPVTYLINDDATTDNSSTLFGDSISLRNNGANTVSWNSNEYYQLTNTSSQKESMRVLAPLTGVTDDFVVEYDSYVTQNGGSSGLVIYNSSTSWEKLTDDSDSNKKYWYGYNDGSFHESAYFGSIVTNQKWVHYKYTMEGTSFTMEVTYEDDTVVTHTETIHLTRESSTKYGLDSEWQQNTTTRYKNIQAYKI